MTDTRIERAREVALDNLRAALAVDDYIGGRDDYFTRAPERVCRLRGFIKDAEHALTYAEPEPSAETDEMQKAEVRRKRSFVDPQNYAVHPEPSTEESEPTRQSSNERTGHGRGRACCGERGMSFTIEQVVHRIITKGRVSMSGTSIAYEGVVVFPEKHGIFCRKSVEVRGLGEPQRIMNADLYIQAVDVIEASQKEEAKETMCRVMKENE